MLRTRILTALVLPPSALAAIYYLPALGYGVLFLLLTYMAIIARCLYTASLARETFSRLLSGALTITFFVYVFVNVAMVSGTLPVVGVPLPLISYGGTSAITLLVGFGLILSVHGHRR